MKKLPLKDRLNFWKYQCAELSFKNAFDVAEYLLQHDKHPIMYPIMTSMYVLYSRPFKKKQIRLSEDIVPSEYMKEHYYLISLRDKMFAHVDTNGLPDVNIKNLSKVIFGFRNGAFRPGMESLFPLGFRFEKTRDLCQYHYKTCHSIAEKLLIDALDGTSPSNVTYEVDLREGEQYILKMRER